MAFDHVGCVDVAPSRFSPEGCYALTTSRGHPVIRTIVIASTCAIGDAYESALCESFFAPLERQLLERERFRNRAEAGMAVFDSIEVARFRRLCVYWAFRVRGRGRTGLRCGLLRRVPYS